MRAAGPNGAGKTTAIRALLGLAAPSAGSTTLLGERPGSPGFAAAVSQTGTLIEGPALYGRATARQNMRIEAAALSLGGAETQIEEQIEELLALVGLADRADTRAGRFSMGMKQRLGLALALLGGPRLVVLDEPTNGLDPAGIVEIRELIKQLPARGTTVLVSSHQLAEVERMCDRATIIHRGRLLAEGTIAELLVRHGGEGYATRVAPNEAARAAETLRRAGLTVTPRDDGRLAVAGDIADGAQISRPLAREGIHVSELWREGARLEGVLPRAHRGRDRRRPGGRCVRGGDRMTAELLKLRCLPTPRWTLAAALAALVTALVVAWIVGPGDGQTAFLLGVGVPTGIASIVLGAWMAGVEYGQGTIRRALTADPRRLSLVGAKLAVVLASVTALSVVTALVATPLLSAAGSAHDAAIPAGDTLQQGLAHLVNNLIYAVVGFALALLTRSMAGGMALALAFAFVIDSTLSTIPSVGDFALGGAVNEIMTAIGSESVNFGPAAADPELARAIPVAAVWVAGLLGAAVARFTRGDVD